MLLNGFLLPLSGCSIQTQPAQYAYGSSRFGEINFDRTASNSNYFIPSNCSWKGNGLANSKYLLDFGYIDTGMLCLVFAGF